MIDNSFNKQTSRKQWTCDELLHHFTPLYNLLYQHPSAFGFRDEVDPDALGIPEYRDVIKNPIALCNIWDKLNSQKYSDPLAIVNDFWLMFENCLLFNRKSTPIYKECLQQMEIFVQHGNALMKELGFCCSNHYIYEPKLILCNTAKSCTIKNDDVYYKYFSPQLDYFVCEKCYKSSDEVVMLSDGKDINKISFVKHKNNVKEEERFVECVACGRSWHIVCVLYYDSGSDFYCPPCANEKKIIVEYPYKSTMIPASDLSSFIELNVNETLKIQDKDAPIVVIREFANEDNQAEYLAKMKEKYGEELVSDKYTTRAVYAFTDIDGVDVMFFGLHAQEFSLDSKGPNRGCVSITYLDSVSYFKPSFLKTIIYQQVFLSYLDYVRRFGMTIVHLWVCPPEIGNDYIFHRHPLEQKLPKKDRLKSWYESIFQKGLNQSIISKAESLLDFYKRRNIKSPKDCAYFDGDFWPIEIENFLTEIDKDIESQLNESLIDEKQDLSFSSKKRKRKIKNSVPQKKRKIDVENIYEEIEFRLSEQLDKWGEDFFVLTLVDLQTINGENKISCSQWTCEILETRDKFLPFCKDYNLEFSSLRRVKYSTRKLINEIFRENKKLKFFCNICRRKNLHTRYFCKRCLDFDLCENCYNSSNHEHELYRDSMKIKNPLTLNQMSQLIAHCFSCFSQDCDALFCERIKNIKKHFDNCNIDGCKLCKDTCAALVNHSRHCETDNCDVYFCVNQEKNRYQYDNASYKENCFGTGTNHNHSIPQTPQHNIPPPMFQSTPNLEHFQNRIKTHADIIIAKVEELKRLYAEKTIINQKFSQFMQANPHLKEAYHIFKKNQEARLNSMNKPVVPEVRQMPISVNQIIPNPSCKITSNQLDVKISPIVRTINNCPDPIIFPQKVEFSNKIVKTKEEDILSDLSNNIKPKPVTIRTPTIHIKYGNNNCKPITVFKVDPSKAVQLKSDPNIKVIRIITNKPPSDS